MFRAYDAERERLVAIKLFKLDLPPERVHKLVGEFEQLIAADLSHPAIVKPLATGISGVAAYLAQEYVSAESLDLAVREYGPAPAGDALRVAAQLAGALDFAGVVQIHHGALHPRDVLLSADETRLTGIGVAQALRNVGVAVPVRRPYTAPERLNGAAITAGGDLFGLAAVVYELLSGKRVSGAGEQAGEVAGADAAVLRDVFARALAEAPADRFDTALEFVEALKHAFPDGTLSAERPAKKSAKRSPRRVESLPTLPLEEPELTDRADIEVPVIAGEPVAREPVVPDLPLAAAEAQRYADVEVAPAAVRPDAEPRPPAEPLFAERPALAADAVDRHEVFTGALDRSRSAVWPLLLALGVGIAVGFAGGYGVGSHDRTGAVDQPPAASQQSADGRPATDGSRQATSTPAPAGTAFTENAITPEAPKPAPRPANSDSRTPGPGSRTANPDASTASGRLLVRSTPAGARVTVDGKDAGVTPAAVRDLASGAHHVRVSHEGYLVAERRVVITRTRPAQSLTVSLERDRSAAARGRASAPEPATPATMGRFEGGLRIESRPTGAKVFLDGRLIGTTPLAVESISAGEHAVRLEYDGYRRWTSSVRIVAAEQNRVTASLER